MFRYFCTTLLKIFRWKINGDLPSLPQYVIIVAPHTSNWDFIIGVICRGALGQKIHFLGKHQLFKPPLGWFFKIVGGIPVDRSRSNKLVDDVVDLFNKNNEFRLALSPEGTRSPVERWKTGFYYIAKGANVPVIMIGLDFKLRILDIADPILISDNIDKDMNKILYFFQNIDGRHPKGIPELYNKE